jgi:hypothetical protein
MIRLTLALLVVGAAAVYWGPSLPLPGACTMGVSGTAAKVRYSGFGAEQACRQLVATDGRFYRSSAPLTSSETVRCQRTIRGVEVTITDTGMGLVAAGICKTLPER